MLQVFRMNYAFRLENMASPGALGPTNHNTISFERRKPANREPELPRIRETISTLRVNLGIRKSTDNTKDFALIMINKSQSECSYPKPGRTIRSVDMELS